MVLFRYKGETYYANTVPDVLAIIAPNEQVGVGHWNGYAYIGPAWQYKEQIEKIDAKYRNNHSEQEEFPLQGTEEDSPEEKNIPYIPISERAITDIFYRYDTGNTHLAILIEGKDDFDQWLD